MQSSCEPQFESTATSLPPDIHSNWSWMRKLLFRFALLYFLLYTHPFPLNYIPNVESILGSFEIQLREEGERVMQPVGTSEITGVQADGTGFAPGWVSSLLLPLRPMYVALGDYQKKSFSYQNVAVDWTASAVFGIERPLERPFASGDSTHSYILRALTFSLALMGAVLWSLLHRRPTRHALVAPWLHLMGRYFLLFTMIGYGMAKVIPQQFRFPGLGRQIAITVTPHP